MMNQDLEEKLNVWARKWRYNQEVKSECPKIDANSVADLELVVRRLLADQRVSDYNNMIRYCESLKAFEMRERGQL